MRQLLRDPRIQLSTTLLLIFISALFFYQKIELLKLLIIIVGSAIIFDLLFLNLRGVKIFVPIAAITSGLIITLLIPPTASFYEMTTASFLAMFSKNFLKGSNRHIFNPAGFGILFSSFIFHHPVSWWAVSFQPLNSIFFLILLSPLLVSMIRLKRFWITIPFIITNSVLSQSIIHNSSFIITITDPTVLFFSTVMLPEPQTTPNKQHIQILFGAFVAFAGVIFSKFLSVDPLIFSLMAGNLVFYRLK